MTDVLSRLRVWCVPVLLAAVAAGCGAKGGRVREIHGTVSYKGEPLQSGTVRFVGPNNEVAFATVQKDGHVGLDLRYQALAKDQDNPIFALVTLSDGQGRSSTDLFRMAPNPMSGAYELYLTDGCLVGSYGDGSSF